MRGDSARSRLTPRWLTRLAWSIAAIAAGVSAVLSLPPFSIFVFVALSYGTLFLLVRGHKPKRSFLAGWFFGLGYFSAGLWWITESFFVDAERFGAYAVPAVVGLSGLLAVFPGAAMAAFAALYRNERSPDPRQAVHFAACWAGAEWLRGHVLTGFPWNLAAYATADFAILRQPAAWFGSYGLSFVVVLIGVLATQALVSRRRWPFVALLSALIGSVFVFVKTDITQVKPAAKQLSIRIVQGNFAQREKWAPGAREAAISRYLRLSVEGGPTDAVLWPETAFPGFLDEDENAKARIFAGLPTGSVLLTGAPDRTTNAGGPRYFNTVQIYGPSGKLIGEYAKHRLVPFGEYVPLRNWLPVERLTVGLGDFTPGPGPTTIVVSDIPPFAAIICYEIIFPGHVVDGLKRPKWIFNASNDAWFGNSIGPEQHLTAARMRAVEEGLPVVRAVNTGISAVIDASGRVIERLELEQAGTIDVKLPPAFPPTLYARFGDSMLLPLLLAVWLTSLGIRVWTARFGKYEGKPERAAPFKKPTQ